mmetsp:Transcript_5789/g.13633  ORF Transcript_5789/g.13633 Transcript_5789/m.13633 type:complete len:227 (-) Transcript_5789:31-711(-)
MAEVGVCPKPAPASATAAKPSDVELQAEIKEILDGSDLSKMSLKEVRSELERRFSMQPGQLDGSKDKLKEMVAQEIQRIQQAQDQEGQPSSEEMEAEAPPVAKAVAAPKDAKAAKSSKEKQRTSGQKRPLEGEKDSASAGGAALKKTNSKERQSDCMTQAEFLANAKSFTVEIGDRKLQVSKKVFSTGSCGFYGMGKVTLMVGDVPLNLQCQVNCTVIGSKGWQAD